MIQQNNLYKTPAAKCWTNSSFEILPKLQLLNLDQPLCSKSEQKFSFMTKRQLPNQKANQKAVASMILSISNFKAIKFTKRHGVSELVSDKHSKWSDSGPIINIDYN